MIKTGSSGGGECKQFLCELSFYNCWLLIQAITTKTSFMLLALLQIICFTVEVKVKLATKQRHNFIYLTSTYKPSPGRLGSWSHSQ